ncbi:MAG: sigma-70 family RNA polymerase sigma factor [Muribaculaceae bacterium]|nr:sigma-70 family RNA polymerase sigma factor [Muribaculaceae bacterium]MDE6610854.1 sigma-70 family RNA polymerase sigma factor [Muribaculaceae bacterium]
MESIKKKQNVKLLGLNMHLTKQNKFNMKSPPLNEREFASLIQEHSRIINKVCYFYATDKIPFEDLRQEIYVNIWTGLSQFRGECRMSTWIYRVSVNSALMSLRSSKPRIETVSADFGLLDASTETDDAQRENLQTLQSLINRLDDIEKAIILLWLEEYPYDEIAETLGLKRNTVAVKIHRIKEKLSKQI